jgi:hypothetical protein
MMKDSQAAINAAERSKNNNMAVACKPNWEIRIDQLAPGESANARETAPGKVWFTNSSETSKGPAVRPFVIPSILKDLDAIQASARAWSQEQTAIPDFLMGMQGEGAHNRTLGGATLQFKNSLASIKSVVFNIEKFLMIPLLDRMARFYQMFSNDPGIIGEYRVVARAVQGLMAKEMFLQKLGETLQMLGNLPGASDRLDYEGIEEYIATGFGTDQIKLFVDEKTYEARMKQKTKQAAEMAQVQNVPKLNAEVPRKNALLDMLSDAKGTPAFPAILQEVAESQNAMTPDLKAALDLMVKSVQVEHMDQVHTVMKNHSEQPNPIPPPPGQAPTMPPETLKPQLPTPAKQPPPAEPNPHEGLEL